MPRKKKKVADNENSNIDVVFAPGCFDNFDGTQEELDELISEIKRAAETGELFENIISVTESDMEEFEDQIAEAGNRTLQ